jgi:hypothetical protein
MCNSLKGYTIHKLFHDTRNFTTSTGEKIVSEGLNSFKGLAICEVSGKVIEKESQLKKFFLALWKRLSVFGGISDA